MQSATLRTNRPPRDTEREIGDPWAGQLEGRHASWGDRRPFAMSPEPKSLEMLLSTTPSDYEDLIRVIHERHDDMSKSYQRIAVYLTQNPNDVAVLSVSAIAERCGVHASNVVRFAQALGYDGFKTLQGLFQKRLSTAAPGFEARVKALERDLDARKDRSEGAVFTRSDRARYRLASEFARRRH